MDINNQRHLRILVFLSVFFSSFLKINATGCDCQKEAEVNKTREHLRLVTRISALKLLPTVREAIYQIEAEKLYVLQRAKYDVMKDMRAKYGNWLAQTDILANMDVLVVSMQKLLNDNRTLTAKEIFSLVNASVTQFHTNVLPSAFLCFALGTCRTASAPYMECLRNNVQQWVSFFGDEPLKMAYRVSNWLTTEAQFCVMCSKNTAAPYLHVTSKDRSSTDYSAQLVQPYAMTFVADAIWQYRKVDAVLQALHNSLITAEDEITVECAHQFHNVTVCPKCLIDDTVSYCRGSCISASYSCLGNLSKKWEANIDELYKLTRRYDEGFIHLVHGISNGMQRLVQTEAPRLAKVIVNKCGPLLKENVIYMTSFTGSELQKPQELKAITKELVQHMRTLRKCWTQTANRTCSGASGGGFCWNGTNIVRLQNAADELSLGIKDVRPRPKEAWLESSGHPYDDTDDEDFISGIGGSGSGVPVEEIEDTTVYTIAPAVTTLPTPSSTPTVVLVEQATQLTPSHLSWITPLTILVTLLLFR